MIDKNKIAKAARQISEKVVDAKGFDDSKPTHLAFLEGHIDGFNAGANWAINEFLKNLWHPASEEPKFGKGRLLVLINGGVSILNVGFVLDQLRNLHNIYGIEGWLYLDDLLPKAEAWARKNLKIDV